MELNEVKNIGLSALVESVDRDALLDAIQTVDSMLGESWLNATNRRALTGLYFQLEVKHLALVYLNEGYCAEDRDALLNKIEQMNQFSVENDAEKMKALSTRLNSFFRAVDAIMCDADLQASRLRDGEWNTMTKDLREIREVKEIFEKKKELVLALEDEPPFGQYAFPDIKTSICNDLEEIRSFAIKLADGVELEGSKRLLDELLIPVNENILKFEYYPVVAESEFAYAGTVVMCTPFADEIELFAYNYCRQSGTSLAILDLALLNGKDACVLDVLFSAIAKKGQHLFLRGIDHYRESRALLFEKIISFGKNSGRKVFVMDEHGDKRIYNDLMDYVHTRPDMKPTDIAFVFLAMPQYRELIELFEEKGMLSGEKTREKVKTYLPFTGFVGLNRASIAYTQGRDWLEAGRKVSEERYTDAITYLSLLPTQSLLLHTDWGNFEKAIPAKEQIRAEIDYDSVRDVNPQNIKKIMQGNFTIFEKCGLICRYCLTHGEDVSVWCGLSDGELEKRLTLATRLVVRILGLSLEPVVTVHETIPNAPKASGVCIGGGKEIRYKRSSLMDLTDTIDTICHESYHAFQHFATHTTFCEWFWRELGVTRGRIQSWAENQKQYFESSTQKFGNDAMSVYRAQVVEAEARAFATDCLFAADLAIEKIRWE